jgi:hypothetical protein
VFMICPILFLKNLDNLLSNFDLCLLVYSILNISKNLLLLQFSEIFGFQKPKIVLLSLTLCDRLEFSF